MRELESCRAELARLREAQEATREILALIACVQDDAQPVFERIARAALRVCDATQANLATFDGHLLHLMAQAHASPADPAEPDSREIVRRMFPRPPGPELAMTRAVQTRRRVVIADVHSDPDFSPEVARLSPAFSVIGIPMLRHGVPIGALAVGRSAAGAFPDEQVALLETFVAQATIAVENAHLFKELAQRNREVSAALEQQTATSEILRVISRSPTDVQPVFEAIAQAAVVLCRAVSANVLTFDGQMLHLGARASAVPDTGLVFQVFPRAAGTDTIAGRAVLARRVAVIPDLAEDPDYPAPARQLAELTGARSFLGVPLLREGTAIGAIAVGRREVGPIPEQQVAVLQTFADQAVIAIENVRLFNELRDKGAQLELASRHKSQFLANMSHELRTPLNAIIGFTRIVMRRARGELEPRQVENLEKILASGQHLLALINALLDLSKIEAGHVEVRAREIELGPVLQQCLLTVEPLVRSDAVALGADIDPALPRVLADEEKLRQIVLNLLGNAAKFTERGSVRLRASAANGALSVAVADTGIGIPLDQLERIFEEFEQADAGSTRQYGGTGLGLAIARRLARLMGGDIAAQSAPGGGSTFTLILPLRYCPATEAAS